MPIPVISLQASFGSVKAHIVKPWGTELPQGRDHAIFVLFDSARPRPVSGELL